MPTKRRVPFVKVLRQAALDPALPPAAKAVLLVLAAYADNSTGVCHPGIESIRKGCGLGPTRTKAALRVLQAAGYIDVSRQGNCRTNRYRVMVTIATSDSHKPGQGMVTIATHLKKLDSEELDSVIPQVPNPSSPAEPAGCTCGEAYGLREKDTPKCSYCEPKQSKTTWLSPFGAAWKARYGGEPPYGRLGKSLRPLVLKHGEATVLERFTRYLNATDAAYVSVEKFAATWGAWDPIRAVPKPKARERGW